MFHRLFICLFISLSPCVTSFAQGDSDQDGLVRGVVKARHEAILSVDLNVPVSATPVLTGESFQKGDVLLQFNCEVMKAEIESVKAAHSAARSHYESNKELFGLDAVGRYEVDISKAEMEGAFARLRAARARVKQCEIRAPYNGKISELAVNAYETPRSDTPLLKIVSHEELELRLIVPSSWLSWLSVGTQFDFNIDETQNSYLASIIRVGAEVDAVSHTVPIIAVFTNISDDVLPGMSGAAQFTLPNG